MLLLELDLWCLTAGPFFGSFLLLLLPLLLLLLLCLFFFFFCNTTAVPPVLLLELDRCVTFFGSVNVGVVVLPWRTSFGCSCAVGFNCRTSDAAGDGVGARSRALARPRAVAGDGAGACSCSRTWACPRAGDAAGDDAGDGEDDCIERGDDILLGYIGLDIPCCLLLGCWFLCCVGFLLSRKII